MRAIALFVILCACLFIAGFLMEPRIRIQPRPVEGTPHMDVVVTVPPVTPEARWLTLYGCSAEMDENARMFCNDQWERASTQEVRLDQRQYVFPWKNIPRGWLMFNAAVTATNGHTLATGETRYVR